MDFEAHMCFEDKSYLSTSIAMDSIEYIWYFKIFKHIPSLKITDKVTLIEDAQWEAMKVEEMYNFRGLSVLIDFKMQKICKIFKCKNYMFLREEKNS